MRFLFQLPPIGLLALVPAFFSLLPATAEEQPNQRKTPEPKNSVFKNSPVVKDGASVKLAAEDYKFTEGPAPDKEGNVYFTDQPNDRIMKWSLDGTITEFMKPAGRSNGLYFDKNGTLFACADGKNELWAIDVKTKKPTVLLKDFGGKLFNGPNDLWITSAGGIYFTDPYYKRNYWKREGGKQLAKQCVYYLAPGEKVPVVVADNLKQPNGIVGTIDGQFLYVADIGAGKTYHYRIEKDGNLAGQILFCELGSDGMTLDREGNVYLTGKGVTVFDSKGKKVEHIAIQEGWTANVCFGGKNRKTLFITAMDSLYTLEMRVQGAN